MIKQLLISAVLLSAPTRLDMIAGDTEVMTTPFDYMYDNPDRFISSVDYYNVTSDFTMTHVLDGTVIVIDTTELDKDTVYRMTATEGSWLIEKVNYDELYEYESPLSYL